MTRACDRCKRVVPGLEPWGRLNWEIQGSANADGRLTLDLCLRCIEHLDKYVRGTA